VSLALLISFSASPVLAESDSYEDMLKKFKSKQADTVKQYEKAAKTSSNLTASPSPPVSDKLPFSSVFGSGDKGTDTNSPKIDMPKVPDMPKMGISKDEAPSVPVPAPPAVKNAEPAAAVPKPISPPAPTPPPVVANPLVAPPSAPVPVAPRPAPVAPTPAPASGSSTATNSQGDYMDRWQRDQTKSGSATKAVTAPSQKASTESKISSAKKGAPTKKKAVSSGKRQGPLPLWFAELVTLGLIFGFGAAVLFLQDALKGAYVAADKVIAGATANFNKRSE